MELVAVVVSFTALAILAVLVGRLLGTILKIALICGLLYFVLNRVDFSHAKFCEARQSRTQQTVLAGLFCKP